LSGLFSPPPPPPPPPPGGGGGEARLSPPPPLCLSPPFRPHPEKEPPQPTPNPATIKIRLNSTAGTGFFYVTKKNPRNITEKLVMKKYDPIVRKHVEFKEGKIK